MFVKAAAGDRQEVDRIMGRIYHENPSYWPNGVSRGHFDADGLYLIRKSASDAAVGFVGWQVRDKGFRKVGYYSVGVLPEFRRQGFARVAVKQLLAIKAAQVDEVHALIMRHNTPSMALKDSLCKLASAGASGELGKTLGWAGSGALMGGLGMDYAFHGKGKNPLRSTIDAFKDPQRRHDMLINSILGAATGGLARYQPEHAISLGLAIPAKDLIFTGKRFLDRVEDPAVSALNASQMPAPAPAGRVTVKLPPRRSGDPETAFDLPIEQMRLSKSLQQHLGTNVRRQLRGQAAPRPRAMPGSSPLLQELAAAMGKSAAASPPTMPSPPPMNANPAERMSQQQQMGQQIAQGASTDANPQIMAAQQEAAQASQQAQQEVAQQQQKAQQQQMETDQQHQQEALKLQTEMAKQKQENQLMKMEVEKARMESEMRDTQHKLHTDASSQGNEHLVNLLKSRGDRVAKRLAKVAHSLLPWDTQQLSDNVHKMVGRGDFLPAHAVRNSYGAAGDMLYEGLLRPLLRRPTPGATMDAFRSHSLPGQGMVPYWQAAARNVMALPVTAPMTQPWVPSFEN